MTEEVVELEVESDASDVRIFGFLMDSSMQVDDKWALSVMERVSNSNYRRSSWVRRLVDSAASLLSTSPTTMGWCCCLAVRVSQRDHSRGSIQDLQPDLQAEDQNWW